MKSGVDVDGRRPRMFIRRYKIRSSQFLNRMVAIKGSLFKPTATPHPHGAPPPFACRYRSVGKRSSGDRRRPILNRTFLLLLFFVSFIVIVFLRFDAHFPISLLSPVNR